MQPPGHFLLYLVTVSVDCQLGKIQNRLCDKLPHMPVKGYLDNVDLGKKTQQTAGSRTPWAETWPKSQEQREEREYSLLSAA